MALAIVLNRRRQVPAEDSPAFGAIAERFRRAGELDRAVALCQEGLQKYPKHLSSRVTLGWALLDLGRYDEARAELEQVLKRAPDNLAAIRGLAELHDRTEHDDVASMQSAPSRWATPEDDPDHADHADHADNEAHVYASPETAEVAESFEAEPGPWIGLQGQPVLGSVPVPQVATAQPNAEQHTPVFANELSEVDALAAELLDTAAVHVAAPAAAFAAAADENRSWGHDAMQFEASEDLQPAAHLLELVPTSELADDDGFIPDEGPGPWPPVFEEDAPAPEAQALRLAHGHANGDAWPPLGRKPIRCAPAVAPPAPTDGSQFSTAVAKPARPGLLSALGRFRRRVDARRRAVVSEYVAG
jgi:hypothetical protein